MDVPSALERARKGLKKARKGLMKQRESSISYHLISHLNSSHLMLTDFVSRLISHLESGNRSLHDDAAPDLKRRKRLVKRCESSISRLNSDLCSGLLIPSLMSFIHHLDQILGNLGPEVLPGIPCPPSPTVERKREPKLKDVSGPSRKRKLSEHLPETSTAPSPTANKKPSKKRKQKKLLELHMKKLLKLHIVKKKKKKKKKLKEVSGPSGKRKLSEILPETCTAPSPTVNKKLSEKRKQKKMLKLHMKKQQQLKLASRDWSKLPDKALEAINSYCCFKSRVVIALVCKNWQKHIPWSRPLSQLQSLMSSLSSKTDTSSFHPCLYYVCTKNINNFLYYPGGCCQSCPLKLPGLDPSYMGSSNGWFVFTIADPENCKHEDDTIVDRYHLFLLDPFTKELKGNLFPPLLRTTSDGTTLKKIALCTSSSPFTAVALCEEEVPYYHWKVLFARTGDEKWGTIEERWETWSIFDAILQDVVYSSHAAGGRFYVTDESHNMIIINAANGDIIAKFKTTCSDFDSRDLDWRHSYLASLPSTAELFIFVRRDSYLVSDESGKYEREKTVGFNVYKLDENNDYTQECKWVRTQSLGDDWSVFLGDRNTSIVQSASRVKGCLPNHIYVCPASQCDKISFIFDIAGDVNKTRIMDVPSQHRFRSNFWLGPRDHRELIDQRKLWTARRNLCVHAAAQ